MQINTNGPPAEPVFVAEFKTYLWVSRVQFHNRETAEHNAMRANARVSARRVKAVVKHLPTDTHGKDTIASRNFPPRSNIDSGLEWGTILAKLHNLSSWLRRQIKTATAQKGAGRVRRERRYT